MIRAKLWVALLLLAGAGVSLFLDFVPPTPKFAICRVGLCRTNQVRVGGQPDGPTGMLAGLHLGLELDAANPYRWMDYAEALSVQGRNAEAERYFERAVVLGPNLPPILMRAANFYFGHDQDDKTIELGERILRLTPAFDEMLFADYARLGRPLPGLLGTAIPPERRAACAWLDWLLPRGTDSDLLATWQWLVRQGLADDAAAGNLAWALWNRGSFQTGAEMWANWLGKNREDYLRPDLLSNRRFTALPRPAPYDWTITPNADVDLRQGNGLEIRFPGTENLVYANVRQMTAIAPGSYRFSAEVESTDLTTNEGPLFHLYDAQAPARLNVSSPMIQGTTPRHRVEMVFAVGRLTHAVVVQIERHSSGKFDNKISGRLKIYEVSLRPVS